MIMPAPIRTLVALRYYRDARPWDAELISSPTWPEVERTLRRMDDECFPVVVLSTLNCATDEEAFEDDDSFHVIGGNGRYALFQCTGPWQYDCPQGSDAEVRLWQSDQGYFCAERNIAPLPLALHLTEVFYRTGSFAAVESAAAAA